MTDTAAPPHPRGISPSLLLFSVVYGGLVVVAGVLGVKIVAIGPLTVEAGIFAFLQLVVLSSAVNELHGPAAANRLVRFGFIPLILSALLIQIVIALPAAGFWDKQAEYQLILAQGSRLMAAGLISYGISQTLNVYIFDRLRSGTGKMVWLRGGIAAVVSQLVDTTLFITIAFAGVEGYDLPQLLIGALTAKIFLSIIMVPLFVQLAVALGRWVDNRFQ
ncbi:MAG: queuosine precursor transporter [Sphingopyxis sp.]|nr:queuosine precursor transporter [Sphingopyxis sp.]